MDQEDRNKKWLAAGFCNDKGDANQLRVFLFFELSSSGCNTLSIFLSAIDYVKSKKKRTSKPMIEDYLSIHFEFGYH